MSIPGDIRRARERVIEYLDARDRIGIDEPISTVTPVEEVGRTLYASTLRVLVEAFPTPEDVETLATDVSRTGYASEATEVVERWIEDRFGVLSTYVAAEREARARR